MPAKETRISVESLRPIAVLYEGDIHELACLLLKLYDGKDRETNARNPKSVVRSRPTIGGVAMFYSMLVPDVIAERVKHVLVQHGLSLGAVVEHDDVGQSVAPAGLRQPGRAVSRGRTRKRPAE